MFQEAYGRKSGVQFKSSCDYRDFSPRTELIDSPSSKNNCPPVEGQCNHAQIGLIRGEAWSGESGARNNGRTRPGRGGDADIEDRRRRDIPRCQILQEAYGKQEKLLYEDRSYRISYFC